VQELYERIFNSDNFLVLDFETTNKDHGSALHPDNSLVLGVWWVNGGDLVTLRANEYGMGKLLEAIDKVDFIVAHNTKFELQWLKRMGVDLTNIVAWDTMLGEIVLHGNIKQPLNLGSVAGRYGFPVKEPFIDMCIKHGVCPSTLPESLLTRRCQYDVAVTALVFKAQRAAIVQSGKLPVMYTRCITTPFLADIEANGMVLDGKKVYKEYADTVSELTALDDELHEITGGINLGSPLQKAEYIYDTLGIKPLMKGKKLITTDKGGRPTDADTIDKLKPTLKKQKDFLNKLRRRTYLSQRISKSLKSYMACVDAGELLYANLHQTRTVTHRLSSTGRKYSVQFQNQARDLKPLFTSRYADDGWLIGEIDGAQLEFRVAAFLGNDAVAKEDIANDVDVHMFTASEITKAGQPTDRQGAKAHTFKPLFHGTSGTKAEKAYYEAFRKKYKGITDAQTKWKYSAVQTGKVRIPSGLEFFFPGTRLLGNGYITNSTKICNYPVQSFATADIIPIALVYMWKEMKRQKLKSFIVNTIHDSGVCEVHPEEIQILYKIGLDCFTTKVYNYLYDVYGVEFDVPLGVGYKVGTHWTLGEEIKDQIDPPQRG
jgi:DNA polymerase I-like protein with 3'-5' exonuclease and polymerase domains